MSEILLILVPSIAVPVALALILTIVCICRRNKANSANHKPVSRSNGTGGVGGANGNMEMNAMLEKPSVRAREFPIANVRFMQELGEGAFGKVYKGELIGFHGDSSIHKVAVKTLKENAAPKVKQDFRREVELMTDLKHPNIVCLLGVCIKDEPMCMLFEYMAHGDLHEYLIMHSPHSDVSASDGDDGGHILQHADMQYVATQIGAGMEYLAGHHFVHRDLAARNILIGEALTVKISDFGLSRDVYSSDYYRVQSKSLLPVRWMPPEAILYGKFTVESDVWSYGVVLWEIYSYGLQPYYGYSNQEVIEMIRARQILPPPEDCPPRLYALMVECWHEMPVRRPSFKEIYARLRQWQGEAPQLVTNHQNHLYPAAAAMHSHSSSGHSHPSSGNTTTTLTGGVGVGGGGGSGPPRPMVPPPLGHGGAPPPAYPQPIPPPPLPPSVIYSQYNSHKLAYPVLYKKPSPPGSVASHKSSSIPSSHSPASSVTNFRPNNGKPVVPQLPQHAIYSPHSPTTQNNINMMNSYNKLQQPATPADMYIPDTRTSDI